MSSCLCFLGICNRPDNFVQVKTPKKKLKQSKVNILYNFYLIK